jgi:glycosyltransferase involved in cell wall biosynthesis
MIRVLHFAGIINRYDFIDTVLARLNRSRFQVSALTAVESRRTGPYRPGEEYPTKHLRFDFKRRTYPRMLWALLKEIRRFRPHIVQAHHYDENIVAAAAVRLARVPCYVIGRHYSDHIYALTTGIKRKVFLAAEAVCNRTATQIAVPAQSVARLLTEVQHVSRKKVTVIPFGLDFDSYRTSSPDAASRIRREHLLQGKYLILTSCRLNREKGLEYLLQAMPEIRARNRDVRLVLLGNGPHESALRRVSGELGIDDVVRFVGWRNDALDWIAASDLVVQPSFCESFCQVLMEALAFEKPVIITPIGAAPEVIGDNQRGRLVPMGDSRAIASAINELMHDRDLGHRLGALGKAYLHDNLGADLAARRYERLYEAALAEAC